MDVNIREVMLKDLEKLCEIYEDDGQEHARPLSSYPLTEWIMSKKDTFLVAESNRQPVGFILIRQKGDESKIDLFSVKNQVQGKGIEKKLLKTAEGLLNASEIHVYVPKNDKKLIEFYENQGYLVYNEVSNLFGQGKPGLFLTKNLTEIKIKPKPVQKKKKAKKFKKRPKILEQNIKKLDRLLTE